MDDIRIYLIFRRTNEKEKSVKIATGDGHIDNPMNKQMSTRTDVAAMKTNDTLSFDIKTLTSFL